MKTPALTMQQVYASTSAMYYAAADARIAATRLGAIRQQLAKLASTGVGGRVDRRVRSQGGGARGDAALRPAEGEAGVVAAVPVAAAAAQPLLRRPTRCGA